MCFGHTHLILNGYAVPPAGDSILVLSHGDCLESGEFLDILCFLQETALGPLLSGDCLYMLSLLQETVLAPLFRLLLPLSGDLETGVSPCGDAGDCTVPLEIACDYCLLYTSPLEIAS